MEVKIINETQTAQIVNINSCNMQIRSQLTKMA